MNASTIEVTRRAPPWRMLLILALLAAAALWFVQDRARAFWSFDAHALGDLWPRRGGFIPHVFGGLIAITSGLIQLWLGLTGRIGPLHRSLGKLYLVGVAIGSAGGFYLALTIDPKLFSYAAGLFMLSTAWVVTTASAYVAIRHGAVQQHREWMIRSYIVTFAFVTFRLTEKVLLNWHIAGDDELDAMTAWACWSVPLLLAEPLLQLRKIRR